jgi:hypothetical protein
MALSLLSSEVNTETIEYPVTLIQREKLSHIIRVMCLPPTGGRIASCHWP